MQNPGRSLDLAVCRIWIQRRHADLRGISDLHGSLLIADWCHHQATNCSGIGDAESESSHCCLVDTIRPMLAFNQHHLAIVRSLGDHGRGTGDHHAGYYYNLTGHAPDRTFHQLLNARTPYLTDWPSMASVVALKRPPHAILPREPAFRCW